MDWWKCFYGVGWSLPLSFTGCKALAHAKSTEVNPFCYLRKLAPGKKLALLELFWSAAHLQDTSAQSVGRSRLYGLYQYFLPWKWCSASTVNSLLQEHHACYCCTDGIYRTSAFVLVMWWGKSWCVHPSYSVGMKNMICSESLDADRVVLSGNMWAGIKSCLSVFVSFLYDSCG